MARPTVFPFVLATSLLVVLVSQPALAETEASLREQLDAERSARKTLEAEVGQLRATVEALESRRASTTDQLEELQRSVQAMQAAIAASGPASGAPGTASSTAAAGGSAPAAPAQIAVRAATQTAPDAQARPPFQVAQAQVDSAAPQPAATSAAQAGAPDSDPEVGQAKERLRRYQAKRDIYERFGVLPPAGQLRIESSLFYSYFGRNRLQVSGFSLLPALLIGQIEIADVQRHVLGGSLDVRYAPTNWLELETRVPSLYRNDQITVQDTNDEVDSLTTATESDFGFGDVEVAAFAQFLKESRYIPDGIANLRFKTQTGKDPYDLDPGELATGNGHYGLSGGVTLVKSFDPAVVFFSTNYFWNMARNVDGVGRVDPGDTIEFGMGLALSLNEVLALTFNYQQRIVGKLQVDGSKFDRSNLNSAVLQLGASYRLNRWTNLNFNLGVGLTDDAPDVGLQLRLPFTLPYRLPSFADLNIASLFRGDSEKNERVALIP